MIIYKCLVLFWMLVKFGEADCDADKGCRNFKERVKRESNKIIKDKTFKRVEVYSQSFIFFDEYEWPR